MRFSLANADNPLKKKLEDQKIIIGTWINTLRDPLIARVVAWAGFDYVFIDLEHSGITESQLLDMCLIARECGVTPIVRPTNPFNLQNNGRLLDIGAAGMIIPHVQDAAEVKEIIASTKFFNSGTRGYCARTVNSGFERNDRESLERADEDTVLVAQFEDPATIEKADEILSLQGIDICIVGRGDLAHTMGFSGNVKDPQIGAEVEKVIASSRRNGVAPGLLVNNIDEAKEWIAKGIRCITYSNELALLQGAYQTVLQELRA